MIQKKTIKRLGVIAVALFALAMVAAPAFGATYNLRAVTTTKAMPDSTVVTMWGFALVSYDIEGVVVLGNNLVTVPGPRLTVPPGQTLTINLVNELLVPVSIIIPGQAMPQVNGADSVVARTADGRVRSFVTETPPTATVAYQWTDIKDGTYLYHSGTHPAVQVQMGLYGAVTKDAAAGQAYGRAYDGEAVILYSEIDPAVHAAVDEDPAGYGATVDYNPKYFLVNGVAADATAPIVTTSAKSTLLVRLLNAGLKSHAPEILGSHFEVIAEDGNPYLYSRQHSSLLLAAGKTLDALLVPPSAGDYPIFDRRLYRSNDPTVQGTMFTFVTVTAETAP